MKKELIGLQPLEEPKVIIEEIKPKRKKSRSKNLVASKNSNMYHTRSCGVAKRIPRKNKLVFKSDFEAETKGYLPHDCVR